MRAPRILLLATSSTGGANIPPRTTTVSAGDMPHELTPEERRVVAVLMGAALVPGCARCSSSRVYEAGLCRRCYDVELVESASRAQPSRGPEPAPRGCRSCGAGPEAAAIDGDHGYCGSCGR